MPGRIAGSWSSFADGACLYMSSFRREKVAEDATLESQGMNLLIVDNEAETRTICADIARQIGLRPIVVSSAEEAAELLENTAIDILLTDLCVPGSSGVE